MTAAPSEPGHWRGLAMAAYQTGDFGWLQRAAAAGLRGVQSLRTDADLDSLRGDPRLAPLVSAVERNLTPCAFRPEARRFDFWVGEWEVHNPQGQVVGHSRVELVSGQCALLENWSDRYGSTGKSLNAYNPARNQWQQFWVGQGVPSPSSGTAAGMARAWS